MNNVHYSNYLDSFKSLSMTLDELILDCNMGEEGKNKVEKLFIKEGQFVDEGDHIADIDQEGGPFGHATAEYEALFPGIIHKIMIKDGEEFFDEEVICQIRYARKFPKHEIKLNLEEKIISDEDYDEIKWYVKEGDSINSNQTIAEISSKEDSLGLGGDIIKSPISGTINKIFFRSGGQITKGSVLATIKYKNFKIIDWEGYTNHYINKGDKFLVIEKIENDDNEILGLGNPKVAITSQYSGILIEKNFKKGDTVNSDDILGILI